MTRLDYPRVLLRQTQRARGKWVALAIGLPSAILLLMCAAVAATGRSTPPQAFLVAFGLVVLLSALVRGIHLRVVVTSLELTVWLWPIYRKRIPIRELAEANAEDYRPFREFGGWGLKHSLRDSTMAMTVSGTRGVRLRTLGNARYLIGSDDADALAAAIHDAMRAVTPTEGSRSPR